MIRVESEETQDYVGGDAGNQPGRSRGISHRAECPWRATRIHLFLRQRCSEKAVRYWQFASVVVEKGEDDHTVNKCQHFYNERTVGTARQAKVEIRGNRKQSWKRKHIVGECGKLLDMNNLLM